jgi:hypothetical protein
MQIFTVISSRMNFFTTLRLPYMLLCCPYSALHRLPLLRNAKTLAILAAAGAVLMAAGALTSPVVEATDLLAPDLITVASKALPSVIADKALGREIGSAIGGRIHAANYVRISAIPLPTVLNSSNGVMANCKSGAAQSLLNRFC